MNDSARNGNRNGWRVWLTGALFTILLAVCGFILYGFDRRLDAVAATQIGRGERFARLEAEIAAIRAEIRQRVERRDEREAEIRRRVDALEGRRR